MDEPLISEPEEQPTRPTTAPDSFTISARAFDSEDRARSEQRLKASLQRVYDEFKERDKELEKSREE